MVPQDPSSPFEGKWTWCSRSFGWIVVLVLCQNPLWIECPASNIIQHSRWVTLNSIPFSEGCRWYPIPLWPQIPPKTPQAWVLKNVFAHLQFQDIHPQVAARIHWKFYSCCQSSIFRTSVFVAGSPFPILSCCFNFQTCLHNLVPRHPWDVGSHSEASQFPMASELTIFMQEGTENPWKPPVSRHPVT